MSESVFPSAVGVLLLLLAWAMGTPHVLAQSEPLLLNLEQYAVVASDEAPGEEQLLPFSDEDGTPGTVIEYQLTARNVGDTPLGDIILRLHVPSGTRYLEGSDQLDRSIGLLQFSIDAGGIYRTPPILYFVEDEQGNRVQRVADPDMYTDLRLVFLRALRPGEEVTFAYRVEVE